jgi:murein DD-endopeptidase MepM/ murein hydrolase activator NlpD
LETGQTTRVSVSTNRNQANDDSEWASISSYGRYIVFSSNASNLVPGDTNGVWDLFVHDMVSSETFRVSVASTGEQGNGSSRQWIRSSISNDGTLIAFESNASNLVSGDTNGFSDVFVHETDMPIGPFLDLPIQYTNFPKAANGYYGSSSRGRVMSWFDHSATGQSVTIWSGRISTGDPQTNVNTCATYDRAGCYDGHNGIDFRPTNSDETVYAAANGMVFGVVNNCIVGVTKCGNYFGNQVWIDHGNGYTTLYGHLKLVSVTNGTEITDRMAQPLGIIGSTGNSIGTHLHFGLYKGQNVVDPYGYQEVDYLWIHKPYDQQQANSSGGSATTPSGISSVTVPAGAVSDPITLELWDIPPVAGTSATLRSTGNSFWMRVLEWLTGGSSTSEMASASTNSFDLPVTITVKYDPASMPHFDFSLATINQWDDAAQAWISLLTSLDTINKQASAETSQPGYFDLQAPLICPEDTLEPNDNYDGASYVTTEGKLVSNLFDIATDEDWFKFDTVVGAEYTIQTKYLAAGVDTVLEIYDTDGVTSLATDDNSGGGYASSLTWQAPADGTYFVRVAQAGGSAYGCEASYDLNTKVKYRIFLPLVNR